MKYFLILFFSQLKLKTLLKGFDFNFSWTNMFLIMVTLHECKENEVGEKINSKIWIEKKKLKHQNFSLLFDQTKNNWIHHCSCFFFFLSSFLCIRLITHFKDQSEEKKKVACDYSSFKVILPTKELRKMYLS